MKFACSTRATTDAELATAAARAREMGFDGIEVGPPVMGAGGRIDDGVEIACLSTPVFMPSGRRRRPAAADAVRAHVDAAARLGCPRVKLPDAPLVPGQSVQATAVEMGAWLAPLADYAAGRGVALLVENGRSFRFASELWTLLEAVDYPNVGVAWDLAAALDAGESPAVTVPTLNTRLQYVRLRGDDAAADAVRQLVTRLMGVGYSGYVAVEAAAGRAGDLLTQMREWTRPAGKGDAKGKKVAATQ